MAGIDTVEKRASAGNFYLYNYYPIPDGTVHSVDMYQLDIYSGISVTAAAIPVGVPLSSKYFYYRFRRYTE